MLVVIAESDKPLADLLADVVGHGGHTYMIAPNGRQALDLVREQQPALLITDLYLPDLDGATLIAALRPECVVGLRTILVTASPNEVRTLGATAVLPLPFHVADLEALLQRLLPG